MGTYTYMILRPSLKHNPFLTYRLNFHKYFKIAFMVTIRPDGSGGSLTHVTKHEC